jgi:hypothetical protein
MIATGNTKSDFAENFIGPISTIPSISISFPDSAVHGETSQLRRFFRENNLGRYFRFGHTSIIMIATNHFEGMIPVWEQILHHFGLLQKLGILAENLMPEQLRVYEIKLRLKFSIPGLFFCKTAGFRKTSESTYRSNDYHKYTREHGGIRESKGIQPSFLTVNQNKSDCSLIFSFSRKYRKHITPEFLNVSVDILISRLLPLVSIYLTQATSPDYFILSEGFFPLFSAGFKSVLVNAGW